GDRGIVEADVRGEAPPDARPLALERICHHVPVIRSVGQVLAGVAQAVADLLDPGAVIDLGSELCDDACLSRREQRRTDELGPAAVWAGGELVNRVKRHWVVAIRATERSGPRNIARRPSFHWG